MCRDKREEPGKNGGLVVKGYVSEAEEISLCLPGTKERRWGPSCVVLISPWSGL